MTSTMRNKIFLMPVAILVASSFAFADPEADKPRAACDSSMSKSDRLAVIAQSVTDAESELEKNPDIIKDPEARKRVGTFAAGSVSDSAPFIAIDRRCWSEFYEAQMKLSLGQQASAFRKATDWKQCLSATFPERVELAEPLLPCFDRSPQEKLSSPKDKTKSGLKSKSKTETK